jgi:hypothetical protein
MRSVGSFPRAGESWGLSFEQLSRTSLLDHYASPLQRQGRITRQAVDRIVTHGPPGERRGRLGGLIPGDNRLLEEVTQTVLAARHFGVAITIPASIHRPCRSLLNTTPRGRATHSRMSLRTPHAARLVVLSGSREREYGRCTEG